MTLIKNVEIYLLVTFCVCVCVCVLYMLCVQEYGMTWLISHGDYSFLYL